MKVQYRTVATQIVIKQVFIKDPTCLGRSLSSGIW